MKVSILSAVLLVFSVWRLCAATVLPTPPAGYTWQLVSTDNYDSIVVDATAAEGAMGTALGLNGSDMTDISDSSGLVSQNVSLTAFDCGTAPAGQVFLITSNTYSASLSVTSSGYAFGDAAPILVRNALGDVQVASLLGASTTDAAADTAGGASGFVITPSIATASSISGPMTFADGESVNFTFTASSEIEVRGLGLPSNQMYGNLPSVDISLRRDTVYDVYRLVPEPSVSLLAMLACGLSVLRRRRA